MIHQLIFAAPKPGMSEKEFQDYWVNVHSVKYASKIRQIKKYLIDTTIPFSKASELPFRGVAEIWLNNEKEQLESLQSDEFLKGARLDEPNWAAFWLTLALDTEAHNIIDPPVSGNGVKMLALARRKEGMSLESFRKHALGPHATMVKDLPGIRGYVQCHARDALYAVGESRFDAVSQWYFDNLESMEQALESKVYKDHMLPDMEDFMEMKYYFRLATEEHWIIGPEFRK